MSTTKIIGETKSTCPICSGKLDISTKCPVCNKFFSLREGKGIDTKKFGRIMVCDSCGDKLEITSMLETKIKNNPELLEGL